MKTNLLPAPAAKSTTQWVWLGAALAAHTGWGAYPVLARYLQTVSGLPSMSLLAVTNGTVLILLLLFLRSRLDFSYFRLRVLWLFALVVVLRSITNVLAARFTLAVYVQLITLMTPFIVALFGATLFREKTPPYTIPAIVFSLIGALLMMSNRLSQAGIAIALTSTDLLGIVLALLSATFLALYMLLVRHTVRHHVPGEAIFMVQLVTIVAVTTTLSLILGEDWHRWQILGRNDWLAFASFSLLIFFGANITQINALQRLGAALVSSMLAWRLVVALLLGAWILGERLTSGRQFFGAALVLITITWYLWQQRHPAGTALPPA